MGRWGGVGWAAWAILRAGARIGRPAAWISLWAAEKREEEMGRLGLKGKGERGKGFLF
jgi:hypothetical protein